MGITIHYRGTLPGREAYDRLRHLASGYARERGWGVQDIETDAAMADRIDGINSALGMLSDAIPGSETGVSIPGRPFTDLNEEGEEE